MSRRVASYCWRRRANQTWRRIIPGTCESLYG